ncbi:DUF4383 domain-containing protein [Streptomyces auratus AGR0001]|uniref:DUF4383 domain-containing protein n=1 Tax=Streptomyces auratus AGR0001 TaxID=1160718 RepID=A0A8B1N6Y2_9ACTN|nr:DUF4383 domain-containing protein [Streptomyces auratus]QTZ91733.1 DUF4383 domain-containing protein [Streptomyces auratus AGR0001]
MATGVTGQPLHGPANPLHRVKARHTRLDEHLPVDHRLSQVYRVGAGLMGLVLIAFGILGLTHHIGYFDTGGDTVAGLNTNGTLSVLSIVVGAILFLGMVIGGNFASTLNIVFGGLFLLSGFVNLALLQTDANFLAFRLQNVLFSFLVGLMLLIFGMYGRVSGGLPHDNPYWRARHPEEAERYDRGQLVPVSGMTAARQAARVRMQGASHAGLGSFGAGTSGSRRRSRPSALGSGQDTGTGADSGTGPGTGTGRKKS